ncbi:photosystem II 5 kDa protein, chloroplastic-like [Miscanthus floridulus]|uniref:photosystem II 5 kDa protein, chloroplastic-like n=1 Tax=Miscanthus floridulus TaxID=154761 RepID=UPI0034596545
MASLTMMASFAAVAVAAPSRRGSFAVVRAAKADRCQQEPASARLAAAAAEARPAEGRRAVMLAAAAAAVAAIGGAGAAMADPKKGSPEAKKKYAPICVTMPTAKICHN